MKKFILTLLTVCGMLTAQAAVFRYAALLDGPSEQPPNDSPGMGIVSATYDDQAHTLQLHCLFVGLTGNTTASHIHAPTAFPFNLTNTAGVATTTPTFAGFPAGVTAGTYSNTLDLTQASSYNPSYVTANGGTVAGAEAALTTAIAEGRAYWNIHTTTFGGGEIRGFLAPDLPPVIHSITATPSILHPPNHKMIPVVITVDATDELGLVVSEIVGVSSNEPSSPGAKGPDWEVTGPLTLNVRADRLGKGNGRIYTITVRSEDLTGNHTTSEVIVAVHH